MRKFLLAGAVLALSTVGFPAEAKKPAAKPAATTPAAPAVARPKLIVTISIDQFSADLFAEYRSHFTGGLKRLSEGAVFPAGYQSHAATETCPGHSTILTGSHPARTGIIANNWVDLDAGRTDKRVYCAEDETVEGSSADNYTQSPVHLKVPTLGDRLKKVSPRSRVVSVSGKDRAAIMMAGHGPDEIWWWNGKRQFISYKGKAEPAAVVAANAAIDQALTIGIPAPALSPLCAAKVEPVELKPLPRAGDPDVPSKFVGNAPGDVEPGNAAGFTASPGLDSVTLTIAAQLAADMKLGEGDATDVLIVGLSATDYVGHTYGTEGPEMCNQLMAADVRLGAFFDALDKRGISYAVVLTADHGGHDVPERNRTRALNAAQRADAGLTPSVLDAKVTEALKLEGFYITGDGSPFGDYYIAHGLPKAQHDAILAKAREFLLQSPQVEAVLSADEIAATPKPTTPPNEWTLRERAAASYDKARSGDFYVILKPYVTPIPDGSGRYAATHGSIWDYDRRVPMLFWWKGMAGFEQPNPVETVDILPTLASLIGLDVPASEIDGRCLDLVAGPASNCP